MYIKVDYNKKKNKAIIEIGKRMRLAYVKTHTIQQLLCLSLKVEYTIFLSKNLINAVASIEIIS